MPDQPISLNLACIVHRLMTSPRGWRVSHLRDELGIAQRTYRKYRQTLQTEFHPWRRRDGTSCLVEIEDGDARYLRLRPPRSIGATDPDLEAVAAAIHLARSAMLTMNSAPFQRAAELLMADFHASLRDRDFIMRGILSDADRMFVADAPEVTASDEVVERLIRAVANRRWVDVSIKDDGTTRGRPLTLALRHDGLFCALVPEADSVREVLVNNIERVEILSEQFTYPSTTSWSPSAHKEGDQ